MEILDLMWIGFDVLYSLVSRDGRDLLFESFNGGEEFEYHHEDEEKSREDDGIDVVLDADESRERISDMRESDDDRHTTPDDNANGKFEDCLSVLIFEIICDALVQHEAGDDEDDDLIECERHRFRD